MDAVFRALADPSRRLLLDALRERSGQTLGELGEQLAMTRQSVTQHLGVLEAANLISTVRRGREKLHYLNPVPLHEMRERWMEPFEEPRLRTLSAVKRRAESDMSDRPTFVYTTFIESTPEKVWHALTDADVTATYWGHSNVSDWQVGSDWAHVRTDGSGVADVTGHVLVSDPPRRLVTTWGESQVTFELVPYHDLVRLTVVHENLPGEQDRALAASGWSSVLSNLKTLLETGRPLPQEPWEMYR